MQQQHKRDKHKKKKFDTVKTSKHWAFPEIFRIPPVEDNGKSRGSLKNENLENSRGLCLKLENSRGGGHN